MTAKFNSWQDYRTFAQTVKFARRYIQTPETEAFLEAVRETAKSRVRNMPKGWNSIWRARRGYAEREVEQDGKAYVQPGPHYPEDMKPKESGGPDGRINSKGIPCFYGATTPETAMAEVRPGMGELVSLGRFRVSSDVQVVDCSKYHSKSLWELVLDRPLEHVPTAEEIEQAVWTHIDHAFSAPIRRSDESPDYVPTQILGEVFKAEGYDGIAYKSMLTDDGFNLAFFNPGILSQLSGELRETKTVRLSFGESLEEYVVNDKGTAVQNKIVEIEPISKK